jgi:hypothetical protein|eukprot:COSAG02_NODE_1133_length_14390_cov_3.493178_13_plen_68_part_00
MLTDVHCETGRREAWFWSDTAPGNDVSVLERPEFHVVYPLMLELKRYPTGGVVQGGGDHYEWYAACV